MDKASTRYLQRRLRRIESSLLELSGAAYLFSLTRRFSLEIQPRGLASLVIKLTMSMRYVDTYHPRCSILVYHRHCRIQIGLKCTPWRVHPALSIQPCRSSLVSSASFIPLVTTYPLLFVLVPLECFIVSSSISPFFKAEGPNSGSDF